MDSHLSDTQLLVRYRQQALFGDDSETFDSAKTINMTTVAVFGIALVINGVIIVAGLGMEISRLMKTLQKPTLGQS